MIESIFGHIKGFPPGSKFASRAELSAAGIHRPPQAGIWGIAARGGAQSIVLSGGYEDDEDLGDVIVYTGQGGREGGVQVADQQMTLGNHALVESSSSGHPVRVIRGVGHASRHSPATGYRYDGLYRVADAWVDKGKSGFRVWRFRLEKLDEGDDLAGPAGAPQGNAEPGRKGSWTVRTVRDTQVSEFVKALHRHECQVCGESLETARGRYAEAAHIRPLGRPHNGPDVPENVLCLCPNHHVLLDHGGFTIDPSTLELVGLRGRLRTIPSHKIDGAQLKYHKEHYGRLVE